MGCSMDPLPFLFIAVVMFGGLQGLSFSLWLYLKPRSEPRANGEVKPVDYIKLKVPKIKRSK